MSGGRGLIPARLAVVFACLAAAAVELAPPASAAEMRARAQVVDVIPLGNAAPAAACQPPRPVGAGLAALLAWDLRVDCPPVAGVASGYRVFYRWDGRTYSRVMAQRPGPTIPLRVRLD